jgi:hypothetical protein
MSKNEEQSLHVDNFMYTLGLKPTEIEKKQIEIMISTRDELDQINFDIEDTPLA